MQLTRNTPAGARRENASPVLLMQILFTAHGLRWHKPAYAASDASQQDWQDGRICATGPARATPPAHQGGSDLDGTTNQPPNPPTGKWDRANAHTHTRSQSQKKNACLPRRAGRIDDLVGPAMLRRGPLGSISDVSDPTSRSPKYISTPPVCSLAALPLIRDIPHGRMVYGSSSQSTHPSPRSAPPIHTPALPSQSQQPATTHHTCSVRTYILTHLHTTTTHGLPLLDLPPGASTLLCRNARRHTCNAPASRDLDCSTAREACCCPLILTLRPRTQKPTAPSNPPGPSPNPQRALPAHIREPVCGREVAQQHAPGFFVFPGGWQGFC